MSHTHIHTQTRGYGYWLARRERSLVTTEKSPSMSATTSTSATHALPALPSPAAGFKRERELRMWTFFLIFLFSFLDNRSRVVYSFAEKKEKNTEAVNRNVPLLYVHDDLSASASRIHDRRVQSKTRSRHHTGTHTHIYSYIKELEKVEEQKKKKGLRRVEAKIK